MTVAKSIPDPADRLPPQDLDAERSVLGSMLLANAAIDDVLQHVRASHFYSDAHRRIFKVIFDLYDGGSTGIDPVTVGHELDRREELGEIGGPAYLAQILETVPHAAHATYYAKIVRTLANRRSLIEACNDILREMYHGDQDTEEAMAAAEQRIFDISRDLHQDADDLSLKDVLQQTFEAIYRRMDLDGSLAGIPTGFHELDEMIGGFQPTSLVILAARPSMGKTALVCNSALEVARAGTGVLFFSLEQSALEIAERMLCIRARVNGHNLRRGELDETEQHAVMEASSELLEFPIHIDDRAGRTLSQIASIARRQKRRHDIGLLLIDYLQLMEADDRNVSREQQISSMTRRLKGLAKDLNLPVIALSQLNRAVEQRQDKRPKLSDLRESGAIEQDADIVLLLHRPEAYEPEDRPGEADLIVAKNRNGPIGDVHLTWLREQLRFAARSILPDPGLF